MTEQITKQRKRILVEQIRENFALADNPNIPQEGRHYAFRLSNLYILMLTKEEAINF